MTEASFPVGKTLYHGTVKKLSSGFPTQPSGNWFATDPRQSILHTLRSASRDEHRVPYLYIYKVIKSPRIMKFASVANFNQFSKNQGFELPNGQNTFAFTNLNYQVAAKLCKNGTYNGWWFPDDQTQVMLCNPSKFLKFVKVLEIKRPSKGYYRTKWNNGLWVKANINKFTSVPAKLNNIININQPSPRSLYYYTGPDYKFKFVNSNGTPVNVNRTKNTFRYKNKNYKTSAIMSSWLTNDPNRKKAQIISNRIKARVGNNVSSMKIGEFPLEASVQNTTINNYNQRLKEHKKNKPNVNINASSIYA